MPNILYKVRTLHGTNTDIPFSLDRTVTIKLIHETKNTNILDWARKKRKKKNILPNVISEIYASLSSIWLWGHSCHVWCNYRWVHLNYLLTKLTTVFRSRRYVLPTLPCLFLFRVAVKLWTNTMEGWGVMVLWCCSADRKSNWGRQENNQMLDHHTVCV